MPDSGFLRCTRYTLFFSCSLHNDVRQQTGISWEEGMTCIYEACYPIIWPAIHYNVSVNLAIRIPTPCSGLSATTNRKIRGSVDILSHVNQHSWERSSGSPHSSNASGTMRIDSQTRICLRPKGCTQQFVRFVKRDIHWRETLSKITPNCTLHTLCYDGSRFRKIVCNCLDDNVHHNPRIRLPLLKLRLDFFSQIYQLSFLLQYVFLSRKLLWLGLN